MASLIPFLDESEALFNKEDVVRAKTMIMENLNDLLTTSSAIVKIELITKLQEQVLKWTPAMKVLEEIIDDILVQAMDQNQDVRKSVVGFIEEVCKSRIRMLPRVIKTITMLLHDDSAMVIKRVVQACGSVYRNFLQCMCSSEDITEVLKESFEQLNLIKNQIIEMIDHENDGIRTNAIKFLEGVVLLQTHPDADSIKVENEFSLDDVPITLTHVRRRKLEEEAMNIFEILLKFHGASHISSVNLIACTGTLCIIAKRRPTLMGQVIEALKNLHSNLPPTLTNSQVISVRKTLKTNFFSLLKQPASFEWRSIISSILLDLGASQNEINRLLPKMEKKEILLRQKRALENEEVRNAKKIKLNENTARESKVEMEIDYEEINEQTLRCNKINEKFIAEGLKSINTVAQLVVSNMTKLPERCPIDFLKIYQPSNEAIAQQIEKISIELAKQLTEMKLGPGAKEISVEAPMRAKMSAEEERNIIMMTGKLSSSKKKDGEKDDHEKVDINDETTRKLRETLERMKDQPKLKHRIKTLKLQEITKALSKEAKHQFLLDAVKRILKCGKHVIISDMEFKRRKIITVFAATFVPGVRTLIMNYIMEDVVKRFDLVLMWIFEEYSLMQGFTRHTYVKSEHKHDYAYNKLILEISTKLLECGSEFRERECLIKRLYLESPVIPEQCLKILEKMSASEDLYECGLVLLKDLIIRRPPTENQLLEILLSFSAYHNQMIRDKAIENITIIYSAHKILLEKIEEFAVKLLSLLDKDKPSQDVMKFLINSTEILTTFPETWNEETVRACLHLYLSILPFKESLIHDLPGTFISSNSEVKRIILRSIENPIKIMGPGSLDLLKIIESCAKGTETLVTRIIYVLTENQLPSVELVEKVRTLYNYNNNFNDVRILIPIILHIPKKEIISALPKFLKLNPQLLKDVFARLLGVKTDGPKSNFQPITPTELLVALHAIDTTQVELKSIVKATSLCLAERDIYTHEILGNVMQQLMDMNPLPTLLMRTVIQSHTLYPRLSGFITNLLHRLVVKQVWKNKLIWDGFVKCCQRLQPASMGVLIQLPVTQLQDALNICPDLRSPLLEYAQEMNKHQSSHLTKQALDLLLGSPSLSSDHGVKNQYGKEPDAPGV